MAGCHLLWYFHVIFEIINGHGEDGISTREACTAVALPDPSHALQVYPSRHS